MRSSAKPASASARPCSESSISIASIDQRACLRRVVESHVREPGHGARESAGTCRILERELPIATCTDNRHVGLAPSGRSNDCRYCRIVDVACDDDVTCATCRRAFEANWRKAQKAADRARVFTSDEVAPLDAAVEQS